MSKDTLACLSLLAFLLGCALGLILIQHDRVNALEERLSIIEHCQDS